jgi:hypothetical protein
MKRCDGRCLKRIFGAVVCPLRRVPPVSCCDPMSLILRFLDIILTLLDFFGRRFVLL